MLCNPPLSPAFHTLFHSSNHLHSLLFSSFIHAHTLLPACPASQYNVSTTLNQCSRIVTYSTPTFADNCPGSILQAMPGTHNSGSTFTPGTYIEQYNVTDVQGNVAYCNFTISVIDTQPPVISKRATSP